MSKPLLNLLVLSLSLFVANLRVATSLTIPTPRIIQGGMGIRISSWKLAREVSKKGELGVISGTAMDTVMIRALQVGDPDGAFRRALASFPDQDMAQRILDKYFIEGGKDEHQAFKHLPMWSLTPQQTLLEAAILANYCEVWLAKHDEDSNPTGGIVGMNLLTKVQLPTVPSLYGAMLADVDYILMGAGIPMAIPGILDQLAEGLDVHQAIDIHGTLLENTPEPSLKFSPEAFWTEAGKVDLFREKLATLKRPNFLPIVSSVVLAQSMVKRASGKGPNHGIDGFVVELPTAGGHNAPPRGFKLDPVSQSHVEGLNERGEPAYGPKDEVDLLKFLKAANGLPFWMAGSYAKPDKFAEVLEIGGAGVQVGSIFALAEESGMRDETRQEILDQLAVSDLDVYTDPVASPTGFPFKVLTLDNTLANEENYKNRPRVCNLGYLREMYVREDGKLGNRCPSEPVDQYVKKGGSKEETEGRKCLCNALCSDAGYPQVTKQKGQDEIYVELPLITIGDDVNSCRKLMKQNENGKWGYSARDVVDYLVSEWEAKEVEQETAKTPVSGDLNFGYSLNEVSDYSSFEEQHDQTDAASSMATYTKMKDKKPKKPLTDRAWGYSSNEVADYSESEKEHEKTDAASSMSTFTEMKNKRRPLSDDRAWGYSSDEVADYLASEKEHDEIDADSSMSTVTEKEGKESSVNKDLSP